MFDKHWYDQIEAGHKYADAIIISHIVLLVLTTLALAVRFAAKLNTKARLGLDDACIIIAQVLFYACAGVNMRSAYLAKYVVEDTDAGYRESTIVSSLFCSRTSKGLSLTSYSSHMPVDACMHRKSS